MQDLLDPSQSTTVISYCDLDNLSDFKLDPPRGEAQAALLTISVILSTQSETRQVMADAVQLLRQEEVEVAKRTLRQLMHLVEITYKGSTRPQRPPVDGGAIPSHCKEVSAPVQTTHGGGVARICK